MSNAGYSNLILHISGHDRDYKDKYEYALNQGIKGGMLNCFGFISKKTQDMHKWMSWIVERNLPLHEIDQKSTQEVVLMQSFLNEMIYDPRTWQIRKCMMNILCQYNIKSTFFGYEVSCICLMNVGFVSRIFSTNCDSNINVINFTYYS